MPFLKQKIDNEPGCPKAIPPLNKTKNVEGPGAKARDQGPLCKKGPRPRGQGPRARGQWPGLKAGPYQIPLMPFLKSSFWTTAPVIQKQLFPQQRQTTTTISQWGQGPGARGQGPGARGQGPRGQGSGVRGQGQEPGARPGARGQGPRRINPKSLADHPEFSGGSSGNLLFVLLQSIFRPADNSDKSFRPADNSDKSFRPPDNPDNPFRPPDNPDNPFRPPDNPDDPFRPPDNPDENEKCCVFSNKCGPVFSVLSGQNGLFFRPTDLSGLFFRPTDLSGLFFRPTD